MGATTRKLYFHSKLCAIRTVGCFWHKGKPKLVVHFGGMCLKPCCNIQKTQNDMFNKSIENFKKLNYDPNEIEILPENLPPKPWY